jgi:hypothetical protein
MYKHKNDMPKPTHIHAHRHLVTNTNFCAYTIQKIHSYTFIHINALREGWRNKHIHTKNYSNEKVNCTEFN